MQAYRLMGLPTDRCDKGTNQRSQSTSTRQIDWTVRRENEEEGYEDQKKCSITDNIMLKIDAYFVLASTFHYFTKSM